MVKTVPLIIPRCYDSHVHWWATGMVRSIANLSTMTDEAGIAEVEIPSTSLRGDWVVGFGWDENRWNSKELPTRGSLDRVFPDRPVAFSRADGHAYWVNTLALKLSGLWNPSVSDPAGGRIVVGDDGYPTGVLIEKAKEPIDRCLPQFADWQNRTFLDRATEVFHEAGISHIRDVGGDEVFWNLLSHSDAPKIYAEIHFSFFDASDLTKVIDLCHRAKAESPERYRPRGIKFFMDGALGSSGALLSQNYPGLGTKGLKLWSEQEIKEMLEEIWSHGLEASVHCIGDEACAIVTEAALELKNRGRSGRLNIEHGQVIRPETIKKLKILEAVVHMQPCHYLSDRRWLKTKLQELYPHVFPWRALTEEGVAIQFGSDTPIEPPSVALNQKAIELAQSEGDLGPPLFDLAKLHAHPDASWGGEMRSRFDAKGEFLGFVGR